MYERIRKIDIMIHVIRRTRRSCCSVVRLLHHRQPSQPPREKKCYTMVYHQVKLTYHQKPPPLLNYAYNH